MGFPTATEDISMHDYPASEAHVQHEDKQRFSLGDHHPGDDRSTASTKSGKPLSEAGSTEELDLETNSDADGESVGVKFIFLDIDGPLAPWKRGKTHAWTSDTSLDEEPYCRHVAALQRIIEASGGSSVVKVVISSNWRTDYEKYPWLERQLKERGIDVIGHTDVMHVHPSVCGESLRRNLELERALRLMSVGCGGARKGEDGNLSFVGTSLPSNWKVTSWIAIDDLPLDKVPAGSWGSISYLCCFMTSLEDKIVGNGWMSPPLGFVQNMQSWGRQFGATHFVKVSADAGLAGTPEAEAKAIKLLQSHM